MLPEFAVITALVILAVSMGVYLRVRQKEETLHHKQQVLLEEAKRQALEIISAGEIKAITEKQQLDIQLDKISAEQLQEFKQVIQNISKSLQTNTKDDLSTFRQVHAEQLQKEYETALAAIKVYRQQQEQDIAKQAQNLVAKIVKTVAGKAVPIEQQQKLILEALDHAKQDGLFSTV